MTLEEAKTLFIGENIEIKYEGRNLGVVREGKVKNVYHDGSCVDILLTSGGYGIKFGVPCAIVHRAPAHAEMNTVRPQVWCALHNGFVEEYEAYYVHSDDMRKQRPAEGKTLTAFEYGACVDCLMEEMHPLG